MHIKLRVTDIFCVPCWTYISFNGIRTSRIKRDIIFTMRGRKSEESRSVYVCAVFLNFLNSAHFLYLRFLSQRVFLTFCGLRFRRSCQRQASRARVSVIRREKKFESYIFDVHSCALQFRIIKQLVRNSSKESLNRSFYYKFLSICLYRNKAHNNFVII